jgi:hypothetical protein
VRDDPKATGYTKEDPLSMHVKMIDKKMVGYTANIPGTRVSKSQRRRVILTMVKQIESEAASATGVDKDVEMDGDVPSLFGTQTTQRYQWDDINGISTMVEGRDNYKECNKTNTGRWWTGNGQYVSISY